MGNTDNSWLTRMVAEAVLIVVSILLAFGIVVPYLTKNGVPLGNSFDTLRNHARRPSKRYLWRSIDQ